MEIRVSLDSAFLNLATKSDEKGIRVGLGTVVCITGIIGSVCLYKYKNVHYMVTSVSVCIYLF